MWSSALRRVGVKPVLVRPARRRGQRGQRGEENVRLPRRRMQGEEKESQTGEGRGETANVEPGFHPVTTEKCTERRCPMTVTR